MQYISKSLYILAAFMLLFSCNKNDVGTPEQAPADPANARFELLPTSQTGVKFSNTITETFQNNILINSYLYNGGGVAVLDVNNDGLPDLYFSATQEPNKLFLNKGNLQFEDITEKAGVAVPLGIKTGVTVADVNGDGWQDIYVCRSGMQPTAERANLLFINNGNATFTDRAAEYGLADLSASNQANFFDYDLDGDLDVYVMNHPVAFPEVNSIKVEQVGNDFRRVSKPSDEWESDKFFRNDNGKFTNISASAGILNRGWGLSVTVSDFNGDGYPDVFVGNDYIEPDYLYINNRKGGFTEQLDQYFRHTSNHTMGVDIADVNNDGLVDLVAADMIAEDNQRQKELMTTMTLDRYNNLLRYHYGHQHMRNVLQIGTGAAPEAGAPFSEIGVIAGVWNTDWSWSPLLVDFDNDGLKDLYVTNGYRRDVTNLDYLNYTVDSVMKAGGLTQKNFPSIDDYLKKIPTKPLSNYLFHNKDGLQFQNATNDWGMNVPSYSNGSATADLDGDGDMDLVVNNIHGDAFVFRNKTIEMGGTAWLQIKLKGSPKNPDGNGARLRITYEGGKMQYQEMNNVRGFFSASQHLLHFGLGTAKTIEKVEIHWPFGGKVQVLQNVPINQRLTLNYADAKPGKWENPPQPTPFFAKADNLGINFKHTEDEFIDFNRERLIPHKFSDLGPNLSVGDVNGDGLEDFFIGGAGNQPGVLFIQNANSSFRKSSEATWAADATFEDMGSTFFDADGDKDLDFYVVSGGSSFDANSANYQDRLYLNDGKGNFTKAPAGTLPNITSSGSCVVAHDFDGDGDLDLFVGGLVVPGRYPTAPQTLVLKNEKGRFTEVGAQVAPDLANVGMVNDLLWADLDGDKKPELIVAGEWLPITVFSSDLKKKTELPNTNGWWNCLQAADLDKDGDLDLLAGNLGLNSRLKASENEPLRLFSKDFDNNGSLDPILAYYNKGKLYPLALRDMMIKQLPILKKKYVRYRAYGEDTMEEVFDNGQLDNAQQFEAQTFATTWFENTGNGSFKAHILPAETQFAPCNQFLINDFNADGHPDLLTVGNSYSSDVETGRYDAGNGCLLLGDGKGKFQPMPNRTSGFWATKAARDLAALKLANGKTLYLVGNNNDVLQGFVQ